MVYRKRKLVNGLKIKNKIFFQEKNPNLLKFKNKLNNSILREEDMINLFLGFIKLVKKSIRAELEFEYKKKLSYYHSKIQNLLAKIK